jgi:molybdopterin-guanine dinucleotide biosynthesis protein A
MGTDKAALPLEGRTLLERALAMLRTVASDVMILGSRQRYAQYGPVVEDIVPECGPLGGIHAALTYLRNNGRAEATRRLALIIAVDTPFLSPEFLAFMAARAIESGAVVTTPEIAGYTQPLCSVYSTDFLEIAEQGLKSGIYKIVPLFPKGRTCVISEAEMARFAFTPEMFDNLNTPQDLERARLREAKKV